jgi:hypothetical protein
LKIHDFHWILIGRGERCGVTAQDEFIDQTTRTMDSSTSS